MWDRLKQADIEQARLHLNRRRDEASRRHSEEMQRFAADQVAIDNLDRLAGAFSDRLRQMPAPAPKPAAPAPKSAAAPPAAVAPATAARPAEHRAPHRHHAKPHKPHHPERRSYHRTNFETFSVAMAKNELGWRHLPDAVGAAAGEANKDQR